MRHSTQLGVLTNITAPIAAASSASAAGSGGFLSNIGGALSNVIGSVTGAITSPGGVNAISQYLNYRLSSKQVNAGQQPTGLPPISTPQNPNPQPISYTPPGGGTVTAGPGGGIDPSLLYIGGGVLIVVLLLTAGRR